MDSIIRKYRKQLKLSQAELANMLNVHQTAVSQWEMGRTTPDIEVLKNLASIYGVSVDVLLGTESPDSDNTKKKKGIKIPVLGYVRAGIPIDAVEEILDYEEIPEDLALQGEFFGLQVKGDSMEPQIVEGDIVIVRKQSDVDSGEVAVVLVNGCDATVKKFIKHEAGVSLVAYNPKYEPRFYTNKEVEEVPVSVIGKVVELRRKF